MIQQQQWKSFIKWKKLIYQNNTRTVVDSQQQSEGKLIRNWQLQTIHVYKHDTIHMALSDWPVNTDYKKQSYYWQPTCYLHVNQFLYKTAVYICNL